MIVSSRNVLRDPRCAYAIGMRRLERRQNAFEPRERLESFERFRIGGVGVLRAAEIAQPRMLGSDGGVVETCGDRMRQLDVASLVLQHERARALQHAGAATGKPCRVASRRDALSTGLDANQPDVAVVEERIEDADGIAAAANARHDHVRQPTRLLEDLRARFPADDRLELADHQRIRMRSERGAEQVVGVADVGDPVAHRLVDRVLQGLAAGVDLPHRRAEQSHAQDVRRLAPHVLGAHVDVTLETEQRARARGRHSVLTGAGLGDDARLAHALGEQRLPERVVDLVRAGVREVLAFEEDANAVATGCGGEACRLVDRRRAVRRSASAGDRARRETRDRRGPRDSPAVSSSIGATSVSGTKRPP